ncbi:MAG: hypothetical protein ABII88_08855 [Candidatus Omnitrophota bacterium]
MSIRKSVIILVLIVMVGIFAGGCAGLTPSGGNSSKADNYPESIVEMSTELRFDDLPVPAGFILVRKDSFVFQNSQTRMGTLNYNGKADISALINFYKRTMIFNGWDMINSVEFGTVIMNFEKGNESCIVAFQRKGMNNINVVMSLAPMSSGSIPPGRESYIKKETVEDEGSE